MDFAQSSYYNLNQWYLSMAGQWPYENRTKNIFRRFLIVSAVLSSAFVQFMALFKADFEKNQVFNILPIFTTVITLFVIAVSFYIGEKKFEDLWVRLKEDWSSERGEEETRIKELYAEGGQILTKIITGLLLLGAITYIPVTIFLARILDIISPKNESHEHQLPFRGHYFVDHQKYFYIIIIHIHGVLIISIIFGLANQTMFCVYLQHIYGMFAVLGYRLEHAIPDTLEKIKNTSTNVNDFCYKSIVICIKHHRKAIEFATVLESFYAPAFTASLGASILIMSPSFYQLNHRELLDVRSILQIIVIVIYLFIINMMGQKLIDLSENLAEKAYFGNWEFCCPKVQKLFVLIIRRCDKPCSITTCSFYVASLDCFRMILHAGISYCMMLSKLH